MTTPRWAQISGLVVALTLFAGCTGTAASAPSSSASASSEATATGGTGAGSSSDAERYAAIRPGYEASWAAINALQAAGGVGAPTQAMKDTLTDSYLAYWNERAAQWRAEGRSYTGENRVVNDEITATTFSPTTATAELNVCVDMSDVKAFKKDGTPMARTTKPFMAGTAEMIWSGGHWRANGFIRGTGGYVDRC